MTALIFQAPSFTAKRIDCGKMDRAGSSRSRRVERWYATDHAEDITSGLVYSFRG